MNILSKFIFSLFSPKIVIVAGNNKEATAKAIHSVLSPYFKVKMASNISFKNILGAEVLILSWNFEMVKVYKFLSEKSSLLILTITALGEIPHNRNFFAGEKKQAKEIIDLAKTLSNNSCLVLNFDDETVREIDDCTSLRNETFGFQKQADFSVNDLRLDQGVNFKINYKGNIVPIWLEKIFGKKQIYAALAASAVGTTLGLNLVQISQALKTYQGLPGQMQLINGIKNSWILDNSRDASSYSMAEAIEVLKQINPKEFDGNASGRKIAVLGDFLEVGKYAIGAHELIGKEIAPFVDTLFTVGLRAKFIAQNAEKHGVARKNIFQFDRSENAGKKLQEKIRQGDLILIMGATEIGMKKIVDEVRAIN